MSTCATPTLTRHEFTDRRLGPCLAVAHIPQYLHDEFKARGFTYRELSGKRDRGGPGHRVSGIWIVPRARWDRDAILRTDVLLLIALNDGSPRATIEDLQRRVEELKHDKG